MFTKILIVFMHMILVISLAFSSIGCSEYDNYRKVNGNASHMPVRQDESSLPVDNKLAKDTKPDGKSKADKSVINAHKTQENIVIVGGDDDKGEEGKPLLDRYAEQIKLLVEKDRKIKEYKEWHEVDKKTIDDLKSNLEDITAELDEKKKQEEKLQEKNRLVVDQLEEQINALKEQVILKTNEIEKLKVELVEAQIAEVKTKQELVRVKTQYFMDKKDWQERD